MTQNLRRMTDSDLEQVFEWRNHPDVSRFMYTDHKITLNEHRQWFLTASKNAAVNLLIFELDGASSGFVNITRSRCSAVADWGFYISPDAPKGAGRELGYAALTHGFSALGLHKICGEAIEFNERSIAFHHALGFKQEGRLRDQHRKSQRFYDVICFGLLAREWRPNTKEQD